MEGYQLTFEDIERVNTLATQSGPTAYIDECVTSALTLEKMVFPRTLLFVQLWSKMRIYLKSKRK